MPPPACLPANIEDLGKVIRLPPPDDTVEKWRPPLLGIDILLSVDEEVEECPEEVEVFPLPPELEPCPDEPPWPPPCPPPPLRRTRWLNTGADKDSEEKSVGDMVGSDKAWAQ